MNRKQTRGVTRSTWGGTGALTPVPQVLIVGAGFAGLNATRALAHAPVQVTLVDQHNHHLFQPLLYQVATGALTASNIATPVRSVFRRQKNARVYLGHVESIDVANNRAKLVDGELDYDVCIVATGATHSYFGNPQWAENAPGLKTVEDAFEIRRRIFLAYEAAERESDSENRQRWLTFVIVGAGPTGVELAGALAEIARKTLVKEFRGIDPKQTQVVLLEGMNRVLPTYPPDLSLRARRQLERIGVKVRTGTRVTGVDNKGVLLGDERVAGNTVLWAAGVQASPLAQSLGVPLDRAGRVKVTQNLTIPGHDNVFVVGDLASLIQDGQPVPGVAPAAIQQGRHAAENVQRMLADKPLRPFRYRDKGSFAVIGRGAAVGTLGKKINLSGGTAWLSWLLIHITYLIGFRNRFLVLLQWAFEYFTFRRGARIIAGAPADKLPSLKDANPFHRHRPSVGRRTFNPR